MTSDFSDDQITFQEVLALMGPVSTNLKVEPEFFNGVLKRLHRRFGLKFDNVQSAFEVLRDYMPSIGGYYRREKASIDRKTFFRKLSRLSQSTRGRSKQSRVSLEARQFGMIRARHLPMIW